MGVVRSSPSYDVFHDPFDNKNIREAIYFVLEGLALEIRRQDGIIDLKLPFDIHIEAVQEWPSWEIRATTSLEHTDEWQQRLEDLRDEMLERWASLDNEE